VTIIFSAIFIFLLGPSGDHQRFARQGIATLFLIGNVGAYKYSGDYFSPNPNPLVHTWSLSVEEQIYIFLPLFLLALIRNRVSHKKITAFVLVLISMISFISFLDPTVLQPLYSRFGFEFASQISFYSPIDRIWQFTIGGLSFLLLDRNRCSIEKVPRIIDLILVTAIFVILFYPLSVNLKISSILASLFAVVIIYFKSLDMLPYYLTKNLEFVGDRSYSIYLVHMPLLYLAKYSPLMQIGNSENRAIQITIAVVASVILGSLSFSKVENRFRHTNNSSSINFKNLALTWLFTIFFPLVILFVMDRAAVVFRPDANLPVASAPLPWDWDSKCQIMGEGYKTQGPCYYGNQESEKSILLIGDSHAASNSRAVIEVAQINNMKAIIFTQSSCPFILDSRELSANYELPGLSTHCISHNREILEYINVNKPTLTILSMRSPSEYIIPNNVSSRNEYRENVFRSILSLRSSSTSIILIGAEPEYIPISTWLGKALGMKGKYSKIPFEDSQWWREISLTNFLHMNILEIFCPQSECKNKKDSIWLFNDEHHLSREGAEMLVPDLNEFVGKILKGSP
jgi:peptidoglycan/LPS O-acetylase OafA/YrhL